jgi:DNA-directed RNA polymerase sigma subunit (sigma70/sigma32)
MQGVVSELRGPIVLSDRALRRHASIERARREQLVLHGTDATLTELALETDLREEDVWKLRAAAAPASALDESFPGADGPSRPLIDTLADPAAQDPYDDVLDAGPTSEVPRLRAELNEREDLVVRGRFGFDGPEQPLREIARALGVTPERVRQIEREALRKMREAA